MSSGESPHVVRFGEGVSVTHPDDPLSGKFLTEEDLAGGRPTIDAPLPLRKKAPGPGEAESKSGGILTFKEVYAAAERAKRDMAKTAAVDPLARVTSGAVQPRGDENHSPLLRNPYAGTKDAADYENGYEHAQSLGHQVLGQVSADDIVRWQHASPAWRQGLADAAKTLGVGNITDTLNAPGKVAAMDTPVTEYFQTKLAGPGMRGAIAGMGLGAGGLYGAQQWQQPGHGVFGDLRNEAVNRGMISPATGQSTFGGVPLNKMPVDPNAVRVDVPPQLPADVDPSQVAPHFPMSLNELMQHQ